MLRVSRLVILALLLATLGASTVAACGWEQTCNTEEWLKGELGHLLP